MKEAAATTTEKEVCAMFWLGQAGEIAAPENYYFWLGKEG